MANETEQSLMGFAEAFGIVACAAMVVATIAVVARRVWKLPRLQPWPPAVSVWPGGTVLAMFLAYQVGMLGAITLLDAAGVYRQLCGANFPVLNAPGHDGFGAAGGGLLTHAETLRRSGQNQLRAIWAGFLVAPALVGLTLLLWANVLNRRVNAGEYARTLPCRVRFGVLVGLALLLWVNVLNRQVKSVEYVRTFPSRIRFGVLVGLLLIPASMAVHALAIWSAEQAGIGQDTHPLTVLGPRGDGFGGVAFAVSVIVFVPVIEELLFRGVLLNWAAGEWHRPWIVLVFAGIYASISNFQFNPQFGPMVFVALLGVGLYVVQRFAFLLRPTFPTRTVAAVWSSSALFAAGHSAWPTPIPLFVLALGLGYLTVRTRDITAAVFVHGMFNAVSFVYLLRGTG